MTESGTLRTQPGRRWSNLSILYKLWLAMLPIQLVGLLLPSLYFLELLHSNRREAKVRDWVEAALETTGKKIVVSHDTYRYTLSPELESLKEADEPDQQITFHFAYVPIDPDVEVKESNADSSNSQANGTDQTDAPSPRVDSLEPQLEANGPPRETDGEPVGPLGPHDRPTIPSADDGEQTSDVQQGVNEDGISNLLQGFTSAAMTPVQDQSVEFESGRRYTTDMPLQISFLEEWTPGPIGLPLSPRDIQKELNETDSTGSKHYYDSTSQRLVIFTRVRKIDDEPLEYVRIPYEGRPVELVSVMSVDWTPYRNQERGTNLFAFVILVIGAAVLLPAIHYHLSTLVISPVQQLARKMRETTPESLGSLRVPVTRHDEIGELQGALNLLAAEISSRQDKLNRANAELEDRVRQRTAELEKANLELGRSNQELDAFAYTVSHDLQAPLRNVSYIVSEEIPDAIRRQDAEEAQKRAEEAKGLCEFNIKMVRGLLDWSRIGRAQTASQQVDLARVAEGVRAQLRSQLEDQRVELQIDPTLPTVLGDEMQLSRVLTNLVSNALKYNDKPGKRVEVGWTTNTEHGPAVFVRDNGIGIRPQHLPKLFNLLVQVHDKSKFHESIGMGLAIVKKIVDTYHGRVWVESVYGEGSTFWFSVPPLTNSRGTAT